MSADPSSVVLPRYPVAIVGAGALGLNFAARLAAVGPVALIARSEAQAERLRAGVPVGDAVFCPEAFGPERLPAADWVILLVKTYDTAAAARTALALRPRGVVSLQNGLVGEVLDEVCGGLPAGQGLTTEGAFRDGAGVRPAGAGETLLPPGFEAVAALLAEAGIAVRVEPQIVAARLAKLLMNVVINPLAAIFRVPNGAVLELPQRPLFDALLAEAWPVLRAEGLALDEAAARERVIAVARATGANRASMLQDVLAGRRTEIDAITGSLLAMAARRGVELPTHRAVFALVKVLEAAARA